MRKIRIILADDHPLIRDAVAAHVRASGTIEVLAQASTTNEAVDASMRFEPDIVLLDIDMPGMVSFNAARRILETCTSTKIIFLSAFTHDHYIAQAIDVGALAYVSKEEPTESVVRAIHLVAEGRTYYSPSVQERIIIDVKGPRLASPPETRLASLTSREMEVLKYIATGMSKKDIAKEMFLSHKTIENHATNLMAKLNIHDRVELTRFAIREALIEP